jgi:predicted dehydrogenase
MAFKAAVVGVGRMGKLHARVLSEMGALACVVDTDPAAAKAVAEQRNCPAVASAADAVAISDAAIIAVPTRHHVAAARPFVEAGKCVLIEKPIAAEPAEAAGLIELARRTGAVVQVGHTERFNPAVVAMQKYAIAPKFIEAHRISPFTFRSADVGVVLDMMIHDLDLVLKMASTGGSAGGVVRRIDAVGVNVIGPHEDICNARVEFAGGCVANLTASRLAVKTERRMRVFSEQAYLSVDYGHKSGIVVTKQANVDLIQMAAASGAEDLADLAGVVDYTKLLHIEELQIDESAEPLRRQAEAFRDSVVSGAPPVVPAEEGLAALQLAQDVVAGIRRHAWDGPGSARMGPGILQKE